MPCTILGSKGISEEREMMKGAIKGNIHALMGEAGVHQMNYPLAVFKYYG